MPVLLAPAPAGASRTPKPVIQSFSAAAVIPGDELASSPLTVYSNGGPIRLQATVTGATTCDFSSNRALPDLPTTTDCQTAVLTQLPVNGGRRAVTYRFHLRAIGARAAGAKPMDVIVSTSPRPTTPAPIVPGSNWYLRAATPACPVLSTFPAPVWEEVAFNADGTFSDVAASPEFGVSGSYTVVGASVDLSVFVTPSLGYDTYDLSWDSSTGTYNGTEGLYNCGWTLSTSGP